MTTDFDFVGDTFMVPYTKEVADYCDFFSCGDYDLDELFGHEFDLMPKYLSFRYNISDIVY